VATGQKECEQVLEEREVEDHLHELAEREARAVGALLGHQWRHVEIDKPQTAVADWCDLQKGWQCEGEALEAGGSFGLEPPAATRSYLETMENRAGTLLPLPTSATKLLVDYGLDGRRHRFVRAAKLVRRRCKDRGRMLLPELEESEALVVAGVGIDLVALRLASAIVGSGGERSAAVDTWDAWEGFTVPVTETPSDPLAQQAATALVLCVCRFTICSPWRE